ncbi:transcription elongation factor SPT6 [Patella vulgata]|uniref:transcription elongation factor SPT6 n=1 Tax=Patella vulgata TaxID=6465 RepID=UPI0024A9414B|nr:transcription elongation factor SPT6 [Patella vulgata]
MSDFLENEAEESERSSSEEDDEVVGTKKSKSVVKKKSKGRIDDDDDDDDEEEIDEALIEEEMKDFINEDVEEDDEEGSEDGGDEGKRKHEDSDIDDQLEDDDYDLLEENLGIKVKRKQKRKRIRVMSEDEDSDKEGDETGTDGKQTIEDQLFEGLEEEGDDDVRSVAPAREAPDTNDFGDLDEEEESDIDDFIVDDEGRPISKGKKKKHIIHSDRALQEAQDIFGVDFDIEEFADYDEEEEDDMDEEYEDEELDVDGVARPRTKKSGRARRTKKSIYDVFEPSELERGHFTDLDNEIKTADMPERFQLRQVPVLTAEEDELEEEAEWIYKQAFCTKSVSTQTLLEQEQGNQFNFDRRKGPEMVNKIRKAIDFMRNQRLEVPFIAFYRKEYVEPELNITDLWRVWNWDEKWTQLATRKKNLIRLFEKMQNFQFEQNSDIDKVLASSFRPLTEDDLEKVRKVQTIDELRDVYQHFLLYYGTEIPKMRNAEKKKQAERDGGEKTGDDDHQDTIKQATRKSGYSICQDAKLDEVARRFGLTPEQFGENLRDNYQRHDVEQCPVEPLDLSKDYICGQFPTEEDALMGARHMVAMQISHDPLVRKSVRQTFEERAKIKVTPTKKGLKEIDEAHSCYPMKYIKNKPVKDLKDDQYLKLHMAEEEGLLKISIMIDDDGLTSSTYFEEVRQLYYRDEFSHLVQQWNTQRSEALKRALTKIVYPQIEKELRLKLLQESKEGILKACCRKLYSWLKVSPYQCDQQLYDDEDYSDSNGIRVMGIAYSMEMINNKDPSSFCALIDGDGEVTDYLRLTSLTVRRNSYRQQEREAKVGLYMLPKEKDMEKIKDFISNKKPHVICVTVESREATMIVEDLKKIIAELEQEEQLPPISVELMDNELAMVYENTSKAANDFREYPPVLRHAISIARRLQDPLIEFAQMCNPDDDIMCLKYHTLQNELNKDELKEALYLEFINRVNEVGVDVNRALAHPHTACLTQFICGLGPRKGSQLLKILKQNNSRLENRTQLVSLCHMGPKVFINCAGFIKIDTNSLGHSTDTFVDALDGSRVHPEAYEWARKMAVDALEYDDTSEDANPAGALEEILERPESLKELDLNAFAVELERQGYGDKRITLYDIRAELNHRYKDLRSPYRPPSVEERFNMITKETPETFYVGKLIMVWSHFDAGNCPGAAMGVKCRLDNTVTGFIPTKMISDKKVTNPEERVQKDLYYDFDKEKEETEKEEDKKKQKARQTYIKRVIVHPSFHNISYSECEKLMANMDQGDVIIRPSSKGADHLTVTWKVTDGILQHIDVREEGKENAFSLGRSLVIGNEEFEDLDEIIARHVQPMAALARDIIGFRYYRDSEGGKRDILEKTLMVEKRKAPSRIPYFLSSSKQFPGTPMSMRTPSRTPARTPARTPSNVRTPATGRTPGARTPMAAYTPSMNIQGVDPATIQRAAAGLSSNIYNTLAQVASATPQQVGSNRNFTSGFSAGNFNYQPAVTPMMTPMMTPSYHGNQISQQTPSQQPVTPAQQSQQPSQQQPFTPSYNPTPRSNAWPGMTTPRTPAQSQPTPSAQQRPLPGTSKAGTDWAKAAEMWAKRKPTTPRAQSSRVQGSPQSDGSSPRGDGTPLIDER